MLLMNTYAIFINLNYLFFRFLNMDLIMKYIDSMHHYMDKYAGKFNILGKKSGVLNNYH